MAVSGSGRTEGYQHNKQKNTNNYKSLIDLFTHHAKLLEGE